MQFEHISLKDKVITKIAITANNQYYHQDNIEIILNKTNHYTLDKIATENNNNCYLCQCNFLNREKELSIYLDANNHIRAIESYGKIKNYRHPAISDYFPSEEGEDNFFFIGKHCHINVFVLPKGG